MMTLSVIMIMTVTMMKTVMDFVVKELGKKNNKYALQHMFSCLWCMALEDSTDL